MAWARLFRIELRLQQWGEHQHELPGFLTLEPLHPVRHGIGICTQLTPDRIYLTGKLRMERGEQVKQPAQPVESARVAGGRSPSFGKWAGAG